MQFKPTLNKVAHLKLSKGRNPYRVLSNKRSTGQKLTEIPNISKIKRTDKNINHNYPTLTATQSAIDIISAFAYKHCDSSKAFTGLRGLENLKYKSLSRGTYSYSLHYTVFILFAVAMAER